MTLLCHKRNIRFKLTTMPTSVRSNLTRGKLLLQQTSPLFRFHPIVSLTTRIPHTIGGYAYGIYLTLALIGRLLRGHLSRRSIVIRRIRRMPRPFHRYSFCACQKNLPQKSLCNLPMKRYFTTADRTTGVGPCKTVIQPHRLNKTPPRCSMTRVCKLLASCQLIRTAMRVHLLKPLILIFHYPHILR